MSHSFCNYYNNKECTSCEWITKPYKNQIDTKELTIKNALSFFSNYEVETSVESSQTNFRNRAKMSVTGTINNPIIGLTGNDSNLDNGQELLNCPIHHPKINEVLSALPHYIKEYNLIPYNIAEKKGELKGLILFYAPKSNQIYLRFTLRSKECVFRIKKFIPKLQKRFPALRCISANIQPIPHATLEGVEEVFFTPQKDIEYKLGNISLLLSPQAFVQTNTEVALKLYQKAATWIKESQAENILDLFCGQGAFSFFSAVTAKKVCGIEINPNAITKAKATAQSQNLSHLEFHTSDAAQILNIAIKFHPDLIIVNPPRRGLGESIEVIKELKCKNLIYSSCSIETLTLDLKKLQPFYNIKKVCLLDMFPHTKHFETLVWLTYNSN